jgi:thioredoxin 1
MVRTVGGSEFESVVLGAAGPVTVEFMSYSCAHCRALESALQQVAQAVALRQQICRVNVALEPALAAEYGVHGTPTLLMFLQGREVGRVEGPPPQAADLLRAVTKPFEG